MEYLLPQQGNREVVEDVGVEEGRSDIQNFYAGRTIFITGATGFLGKVLLEKLLRSCPEIRKIYLLVRIQHQYSRDRRIEDMFHLPIFDYLRQHQPRATDKVEFMRGDCSLPNLGVGPIDWQRLFEEVDVVLHCAATSMFDADFKTASDTNVRAVQELLQKSGKMKHLKAYVHVSSLYVNCLQNTIEESFMKPFISGKALLEFVGSMDPNSRHTMPINLGKWPNNHLLTKSIGEDIIRTEGGNLPISVVRHPIMLSTSKYPCPGWTDNINGPTGLVMTTYLGLNKTILAKTDNMSNLVPVDYVANVIIAAAWETANSRALNDNQEVVNGLQEEEGVQIYNVAGSTTNGLTWGTFFELSSSYGKKLPTTYMLWHPWHLVHQSKRLHFYIIMLLHYVPAYILDIVGFPFTYQAKYLGYYHKIDTISKALSYFTMNTWQVRNKNIGRLWQKLSEADRELFDFDLNAIEWHLYLINYIRGIRVYILKDGIHTLEMGIERYKRLLLTLVGTLSFGLYLVYFLTSMLCVFLRF